MRSAEHQQHIDTRISHSRCPECRADTERRFVDTAQWRYQHVHEYLAYVRPLLALIRAGDDSVEARTWHRKFRKALDKRIALKTAPPIAWRKRCDSYLDRLRNIQSVRPTEQYLRQYAQRGASCLDW